MFRKNLDWKTIWKLMIKLGYTPKDRFKKNFKKMGKSEGYKFIYSLIKKHPNYKTDITLDKLQTAMHLLFWQGIITTIRNFDKFKEDYINPFLT